MFFRPSILSSIRPSFSPYFLSLFHRSFLSFYVLSFFRTFFLSSFCSFVLSSFSYIPVRNLKCDFNVTPVWFYLQETLPSPSWVDIVGVRNFANSDKRRLRNFSLCTVYYTSMCSMCPVTRNLSLVEHR